MIRVLNNPKSMRMKQSKDFPHNLSNRIPRLKLKSIFRMHQNELSEFDGGAFPRNSEKNLIQVKLDFFANFSAYFLKR